MVMVMLPKYFNLQILSLSDDEQWYVFVCVYVCVCGCCIEHFYQFTPISMLCVKFEIFCTITPFCQHIYEYYHTKIHCHNSFGTRRESRFESLKVLSYDFFGGRWSSAGSRLFAPLIGCFLLGSAALRSSRLLWLWSSRLTGPLGEFHFTSWITGSAENRREDR